MSQIANEPLVAEPAQRHSTDDLDKPHGSGDALVHLAQQLEAEYDRLLSRLTSALHSRDFAAEALHDAYLKLRGGASIGTVAHPFAYLYRMTINIAHNRERHESRLTSIPADGIASLADEQPDPERAAGERRDIERALAALDALPAQRRGIFLARWRDDKSHAVIAAEFQLHKRTVQKELARAERYLRATLQVERTPVREPR